MDTRTSLQLQRRTMFRDTLTSKPVWLILGLLLGMMIAPNSGGFSPGWFWTIVAFGLGGLVVQLAHLVHGRRRDL